MGKQHTERSACYIFNLKQGLVELAFHRKTFCIPAFHHFTKVFPQHDVCYVQYVLYEPRRRSLVSSQITSVTAMKCFYGFSTKWHQKTIAYHRFNFPVLIDNHVYFLLIKCTTVLDDAVFLMVERDSVIFGIPLDPNDTSNNAMAPVSGISHGLDIEFNDKEQLVYWVQDTVSWRPKLKLNKIWHGCRFFFSCSHEILVLKFVRWWNLWSFLWAKHLLSLWLYAILHAYIYYRHWLLKINFIECNMIFSFERVTDTPIMVWLKKKKS